MPDRRETIIVWMRRTLRVQDNTPLWTATREGAQVVPVVCLRDDAESKRLTGRRVFTREALVDCEASLRAAGSRLFVRTGRAEEEIPAVAHAHQAAAVHAVRVYDPAGIERDRRIAQALSAIGVEFHTFKDAVLFEGKEVRSRSGTPFKVFTPYKKAWLEHWDVIPPVLPTLRKISSPSSRTGDVTLDRFPGMAGIPPGRGERMAREQLRRFLKDGLRRYRERRDYPGLDGTSRLSPYLAAGALSIRSVFHAVREAEREESGEARVAIETFLSELIWREFYYQVLLHFPHVVRESFREEFNDIPWSVNRRHFAAWCKGQTGYPIVDAAMRQLQHEGWMHNRARMIVASFLTKDLHLNWQWGEKHFFDRLIDADIASNVGGWQWTAGTGTDASPWFRIFNPVLQGERFDPEGVYVRRYVPELSDVPAQVIHRPWSLSRADQLAIGCVLGKNYPLPLVRHEEQRKAALMFYRKSRERHPVS
jgi:deoxyribodipyrimidine photo-lyase